MVVGGWRTWSTGIRRRSSALRAVGVDPHGEDGEIPMAVCWELFDKPYNKIEIGAHKLIPILG